jgi:hypothetical protein
LQLIDINKSPRQLNGTIVHLIKSLEQVADFYDYKTKYKFKDNDFTKWISASYTHWRKIYNQAWYYLELYHERNGKFHKMTREFDMLPIVPNGLPWVDGWNYKGEKIEQQCDVN